MAANNDIADRIRTLAAKGLTPREIADSFPNNSVTITYVNRVLNRKAGRGRNPAPVELEDQIKLARKLAASCEGFAKELADGLVEELTRTLAHDPHAETDQAGGHDETDQAGEG